MSNTSLFQQLLEKYPLTELAHRTELAENLLFSWKAQRSAPSINHLTQFARGLRLDSTQINQLFSEHKLTDYTFAKQLSKYVRGTKRRMTIEQLARESKLDRATITRWADNQNLPSESEALYKCADALKLNLVERHLFLQAAGYSDNLSCCVIGKPIVNKQQFFGRSEELKSIIEQWQREISQNLVLIGPKGSGKTSLLYQLAQDNEENSSKSALTGGLVLVDFKDPRMRDRERLMQHLLNSLKLPIPEPCSMFNFFDLLDTLQSPCFMIFDHCDVIEKDLENAHGLNWDFWDGLRARSQRFFKSKLALLVTARKIPRPDYDEQRPSPFLNTFGRIIEIMPLSHDEMEQFFDTVALISGVDLTVELRAWLMEHSGGWPAQLQILTDSYVELVTLNKHLTNWQSTCLDRLKLHGFF